MRSHGAWLGTVALVVLVGCSSSGGSAGTTGERGTPGVEGGAGGGGTAGSGGTPPASTDASQAGVGGVGGSGAGGAVVADAAGLPPPTMDAARDVASDGRDAAAVADAVTPDVAGVSVDADQRPGAGSFPPGAGIDRFGNACPAQGRFGFGDGSLLVCDGGRWRYALRSELPDAPSGGFRQRPLWYPPLRTMFGLPAEDCHIKLGEAPIAPANVLSIIPNGAMIAGHVTPIDHWYINVSTLALSPSQRMAADYVPIRAAADGVIVEASSLGSPTSMRVTIKHACESVTTYMVINKLAGLLAPYQDMVASGQFVTPNLPIKAGETFGGQRDNPLDFSLADGQVWLTGFAHPFAYASQDAWKPYIADPLPYWPPAISDAYTAKMQRTAAPRAGKIDWDKPGSAAGNWYAEGTIGYAGAPASKYANATAQVPSGFVEGKNGYSWGHLSLAPHWVQPSVWIASLGVWKDPAGDFRQFAIRPGPPAPDQLTPASGVVVYELADWSITGPNGEAVDVNNIPVGYQVKVQDQVRGILAVRVNADGTLTVEKRSDLTRAADFGGTITHPENYWR